MKIIGSFLGILVVLCSCQNKSNNIAGKPTGDKPYMYFQEETYNAGKINQGDKVIHQFTLENRGKTDLVLKSVNAGCGCTVAKYEEKPIPPGKSTTIEVTFNSDGRSGTQNKTVTVVSNAIPDTKILTLRCEVVLPNKIKKE